MSLEVFPPYDEDTIANQINQIFKIYNDLCHFRPGDLVFPPDAANSPGTPTARHDFPQSTRDLFSSLDLSPKVVSLLERVPYVTEWLKGRYYIYRPETEISLCIDEEQLRDARRVFDFEPEDGITLGPSELALGMAKNLHGFYLILNLDENSIRVYNVLEQHWDTPDDEENEPAEADRKTYFSFCPPRSLPAFLEECVSDLQTLKTIPWGYGDVEFSIVNEPPVPIITPTTTDAAVRSMRSRYDNPDEFEKRYYHLRYILASQYGWPDRFDKVKWAAECEQVWNDVDSVDVPLQQILDER